ncbi:hypothetical protein BDN67DRAFT_916116, partial [Paxillus ammoniavirescens]
LKPIAPTVYDGLANLRAFHRFVTEGTAYIEARRVKSWEQFFILSHYLKGRAHEFYIREISNTPHKWRLRNFFLDMFNYCFPINYRTKQHEKLKCMFQNEHTIRDYVSELNELWNLIRDVSECDKVMKLWFRLNGYIQSDLWKDKLHPEESSLRAVVNAAEVIEIAHSVNVSNDPKPRERDWPPKGNVGANAHSLAGGGQKNQKAEMNLPAKPSDCE